MVPVGNKLYSMVFRMGLSLLCSDCPQNDGCDKGEIILVDSIANSLGYFTNKIFLCGNFSLTFGSLKIYFPYSGMFFFISPKNIYAFEFSVKCCIISDHLFVCPHIVSHAISIAFFKWMHEWAQNRPRLRTTLTKCSYKCTFKYMYLPHINPRTWIQSSIVYYDIFPVHHPLWYLASICIRLPQLNNNDTNILVPLYQKQLEWNKIVTKVYACRPSNSWNVLKLTEELWKYWLYAWCWSVYHQQLWYIYSLRMIQLILNWKTIIQLTIWWYPTRSCI